LLSHETENLNPDPRCGERGGMDTRKETHNSNCSRVGLILIISIDSDYTEIRVLHISGYLIAFKTDLKL